MIAFMVETQQYETLRIFVEVVVVWVFGAEIFVYDLEKLGSYFCLDRLTEWVVINFIFLFFSCVGLN